MKLKNLAFLSIALFGLLSCEKQEGEGGTSRIKGNVYEIQYDASFQLVIDTVPYVEEDVFIIYGNNSSTYDDDYKTSYDGSYKFPFLQKGNYRIFAYSDDSTGAAIGNVNSANPKIPVIVRVTIDKNGSEFIAPDIYIIKNNR